MRVLQLTNKVPFPPHDGGAIAMLDLSKLLLISGFSVDMLAMNTQKHYQPNCKQAAAQFHENFRLFCVEVSAKTSPLGALTNFLFDSWPYTARRFYNKTFIQTLQQLLQKNNYQLVIFDMLYTTVYLHVVKKHPIPVVYRAHNIESTLWFEMAQQKPWYVKWYYRHLSKRINSFEKKAALLADAIMPISPTDAFFFKTANIQAPIFELPTSVEATTNTATPPEKPDLFYIGGLDWQPNIEGLLWFTNHVWPLVLRQIPDLKLHVAGRNASRQLAAKLHNTPHLIFYGEINNAAHFFGSHHIMISPLFSGSGIRIKILEAMASGKAVVATPKAVQGLNIVDYEHVLLANNPTSFARLLVELLHNHSLQLMLQNNAKKYIRNNFNSLVLAENLNRFLQTLLKKTE